MRTSFVSRQFVSCARLWRIGGVLCFALLLKLPATVLADATSKPKSSIVPQLIDLPGTYRLEVPLDTFQSDPAYLEAYLNDEEVFFSGFLSSRVIRIVIGPPVRKSESYRVWSYARRDVAINSQKRREEGELELLGEFEARLVHGLRGPFCSLEISGQPRGGGTF
jgi:hypothetical protein